MNYTEEKVIRYILAAILAQGWTVSVCDDYDSAGEWVVKCSTDLQRIISAMGSTGGDFIRTRDAQGAVNGSLVFIYGNGQDVLSNYGGEAVSALLDSLNLP